MALTVINGVIEAVTPEPKPKQNKKRSPIPPMYKEFEQYYYSDLREIVEERNKILDYVASITRNINN